MIEWVKFTNVDGRAIFINDDQMPTREFNTEVDVRMTQREKALQHGLYPSNTYYGKRVTRFEGDILCNTSAEYITKRREMMAACVSKPHLGYAHVGTLEMLFTGMDQVISSECTIEGYPEAPMLALRPSIGPYLLAFKSFDPRMYGQATEQDVDYGTSENLGGRTYDKTYNKTYLGSGLSGSDYNLVNAGDIETYPTVVFHGPVEDPALVLFRGDGETLRFIMTGVTLGVGETIDVDFLRRTAVRDDGTNLYNNTIGSDWWALEPYPTTNLVRFIAEEALAPAKAVVTWRNAYMI